MGRCAPCCHKVDGMLECTLWFASSYQSYQISCQVCSSRIGVLVVCKLMSVFVKFVAHLAPLQPHVARLLELS